eukprot:4656625-Amphidinium_carterae.2
MQARNGRLTHELTQANLRVLQLEEAQQHPYPTVVGHEGEQDAAMRSELTTLSEHLAVARRMRVSTAHEHYQLQRNEASLREEEIMVSRERDNYYEELIAQVQQTSMTPFHPTAVAVSTPAPGVTAPSAGSVLATATLPVAMNPPVQYAPPSAVHPTPPVQQRCNHRIIH